jgi:hypothetical protein
MSTTEVERIQYRSSGETRIMKLGSLLSAGGMILLATALAPVMFAQGDRIWNLAGTVTDMSFRTFPAATVTVVNRDTRLLRTVMTGEDGQYRVNFLWPGAYNIKITAKGYKTIEFRGLAIGPDAVDPVALSFSLEAEPSVSQQPSRPK